MTTEPRAASPAQRRAVFERTVDGFGTVRLVPVVPEADAGLIHGWVTQERARFWGMLDADRDRVREIYGYLDGLSTHHAYLVLRDGRPVALFQTYEPEHDPVGERYEVRPGDFGVHFLVGPAEGGREPGFTGTLCAVLLEFVFADPGRKRIVAEPDVRNEKMITRLLRTGFELGPEIDLPGKRARLCFFRRETYEALRAESAATGGAH